MKVLFLFLFLFLNSLFSANNAKLLVVDKNIYEKINNLNILNDGIKVKYLISSTDINSELKKIYPEYYLYNGEKCNIINEISLTNIDTFKKENLKYKPKKIQDIVKKVKLLQILLNDNKKSLVNNKNLMHTIISLGVICDNKLIIKGNEYLLGDDIANNKINLIDADKSIIYLIKGN